MKKRPNVFCGKQSHAMALRVLVLEVVHFETLDGSLSIDLENPLWCNLYFNYVKFHLNPFNRRMTMFYKKSFGRFFYRFVLETINIFCLSIDCLSIMYIEKIGFKKNTFFLPIFVYLNCFSWSVSQPIWSNHNSF